MMETRKKVRDKRKVLLIMPLVLWPLMALAFYALGGGRASSTDGDLAARGMNLVMPDASLKSETAFDKMGVYAGAVQDTSSSDLGGGLSSGLGFKGDQDERALEIDAKLAALNKEVNAPALPLVEVKPRVANGLGNGMKDDVERLELLMNSMKQDKQQDPEMEQMNGLLEKILEIQNPGKLQQRVVLESKFSAITAVVSGNQKVTQGGTVKLKLMDSVDIAGIMLPKGHLLFGSSRIVSQRLLLDIKNIRLDNQIIPVNLSVYSLDGMAGIDAPDAVFGNAVGMGAENAMGGISVYGMEGISGQVAGAGIDAAKSLFAKKVRVVKVKLKDNLPVLLRVNK